MQKTILITGATRGIGRETARQLADLGYRVIIAGRDADQARDVAEKTGAGAGWVQLDVTDDDSV